MLEKSINQFKISYKHNWESQETLPIAFKTPSLNKNNVYELNFYKKIREILSEEKMTNFINAMIKDGNDFFIQTQNFKDFIKEFPLEKKNFTVEQHLSILDSFSQATTNYDLYKNRILNENIESFGDKIIDFYVLKFNSLVPLISHCKIDLNENNDFFDRVKIYPRYGYRFNDSESKIKNFLQKKLLEKINFQIDLYALFQEHVNSEDINEVTQNLKKKNDINLIDLCQSEGKVFNEILKNQLLDSIIDYDFLSVIHLYLDKEFLLKNDLFDKQIIEQDVFLQADDAFNTKKFLNSFRQNLSDEEFIIHTTDFLRKLVYSNNRGLIDHIDSLMPLSNYNWNGLLEEKPLFFEIKDKDLFIYLQEKTCQFDYHLKFKNNHVLNYLINFSKKEAAPLIQYISKNKYVEIQLDDKFIDSLLMMNKVEFLKSMNHNKDILKDIFSYQRGKEYFGELLISVDNYARLEDVFAFESNNLDPLVVEKLRSKHMLKLLLSNVYANSKRKVVDDFICDRFFEMSYEQKNQFILKLSKYHLYIKEFHDYTNFNQLLNEHLSYSEKCIENIIVRYINENSSHIMNISHQFTKPVREATVLFSLTDSIAQTLYKNSIQYMLDDIHQNNMIAQQSLSDVEKSLIKEITQDESSISLNSKLNNKLNLKVYEYNQTTSQDISATELFHKFEIYFKTTQKISHIMSDLFDFINLKEARYGQKFAERYYKDLSLSFLKKEHINYLQDMVNHIKDDFNQKIIPSYHNDNKDFFIALESTFIIKNLNIVESVSRKTKKL